MMELIYSRTIGGRHFTIHKMWLTNNRVRHIWRIDGKRTVQRQWHYECDTAQSKPTSVWTPDAAREFARRIGTTEAED